MRKLLLVIAALAASLVITQAPAGAAQAAPAQASVGAADRGPAPGGRHSPARHGTKPYHPITAQMSTGGCGFLQLCVYFNRNEQRYIGIATAAGIASLICLASAGVACAVAPTVAAVASTYVDRHGLCPSSRPRLRIKIFPSVTGDPQCVS